MSTLSKAKDKSTRSPKASAALNASTNGDGGTTRQSIAMRDAISFGSTSLPLVVGVSTRALFSLEEEHEVFVREGEDAYCALQRDREAIPLGQGCAFEPIKRLLALNPRDRNQLVEVVLLSRNPPDLALRAFRSCEHYNLSIVGGSFTSGRPIAPFAAAWGVDLFLSNDEDDVLAASAAGMAAARLGPVPAEAEAASHDEVHFALDGDAVIFSAESERVFRLHGLETFERHERSNALVPMAPGPLGGAFLQKLVQIRRLCVKSDGTSRVRITIVTARNAPAHERVIRTLRCWNAPFDEAHFVGHRAKSRFLAAAGAHIFFDDREANVNDASRLISAGLVPWALTSRDRNKGA
jgi:5'-nucleotidase